MKKIGLFHTAILSSIATTIKLIAALLINKVIAIQIGPSGLALIGQFQNFTQIALVFAQGAINTGITKHTSEYSKDELKLNTLFSTAYKISLTSSLIISFLIIILSKPISHILLKSDDYTYILILFGVTIPLFVANNIILSILSGLTEVKKFITINIVQNIYSLILTIILIFELSLDGALLSLAINQSLIFFFAVWMVRKHDVIKVKNFLDKYDKAEAKKLFGFAAIAITTALSIRLSHLFIRQYLGNNLSWDDAGYWQAIWYISNMYFSIIGMTIGLFYFPKLSKTIDKKETQKTIINGLKVFVPILLIISITTFFLRDFIIWLLFTKDFIAMRDLFLWQLIGDFIKLVAILFAQIMLAKSMIKASITTEIISSTTLIIISLIFINKFNLIGITYAFALNYLIYLFMVLAVTKKHWY